MSLEAELDSAVQRVDNTLTLGFLASASEVLENAHLISEQDILNFRETVKTLHTDPSPIKILFESNDRIVSVLNRMYGANGLVLNMLHHTWRPYLFSWLEILSEWGLEIVNKAKMFFNCPVVLTQDGLFKESRLYSQSLLDLGQVILNFCESVRRLEASPWLPSHIFDPFEEIRPLDEDLSSNLGFQSLDVSSFYKSTLDFKRGQFAAEFEHLLNCLESFQCDRMQTDSHSDAQQTQFLCETLRSLLYQLESIKLASSSSFLFLELRRQRIISLLYQSAETLRPLTRTFTASIGTSKDNSETSPDDLKARLSFEAMKFGLATKLAEDVVDKFFSYCRHNLISSKDIIAAEASKIHPHLSANLLATFQGFTKELNLSNCYAQQKPKTLKGLDALEKGFQAMLKSVKALTIASLLTGCGVKTAPKSEVLETPPAIPFKEMLPSSEPANATYKDPLKVQDGDKNNANQPKN